ncbi:MAG: hypothetical protein K0R89_1241 [Ramlibacter sp.]|nr:hypothetical protein [Ramlibacter sp.]
MRNGGEEARLHLGCVVHARRHAVREQIQQEGFFLGRGRLDQLDHVGGLLGGQRQRGDAERGALGNVFNIGLQHGDFSP